LAQAQKGEIPRPSGVLSLHTSCSTNLAMNRWASMPFPSVFLILGLRAVLVSCNDQESSLECSDEACLAALADYSSSDSLHLLQRSAELRREHAAVQLVQAGSSQAAIIDLGSSIGRLPRGGSDLYHVAYYIGNVTVTPSQCSEFTDNMEYVWIGLTIPSVMVVLFCCITYYLSIAFPIPPASESVYKVTRVDAKGFPVHINWHFVNWTGLAIGMANVNYVVVLPIAVDNFSGSLVMAGFWVGLYAVGALISMPVFIWLGHEYTRTCLFLHGFTTLIGNIIMIVGAEYQNMTLLMTGRIATGLAFGIYYTCNNGCLYLIPTWDRLEAIFISRCVYSIGFALGPCISPLCNILVTRQPWVLDMFPNYNAASEAVPLVLMAAYGLAYCVASLLVFKDVEILDAETEGVGVGASVVDPSKSEATPEQLWTSKVMFSSVVFTNFTRNFIRVLWETGTVMLLSKQYCISTVAGIVVSIVAITLVVSRGAMAKLGLACKGDTALLMRILEWGGAASIPLMFLWGSAPNAFTLSLFLIGGIIFYNSNASQSGVLLALGGEYAIPGHFWLDKVALNTYMYVSMLVAYIFGPICTFMSQEMNPGQNTVAWAVGFVTFLQIFVTYFSVRPKAESEAKNEAAVKEVK